MGHSKLKHVIYKNSNADPKKLVKNETNHFCVINAKRHGICPRIVSVAFQLATKSMFHVSWYQNFVSHLSAEILSFVFKDFCTSGNVHSVCVLLILALVIKSKDIYFTQTLLCFSFSFLRSFFLSSFSFWFSLSVIDECFRVFCTIEHEPSACMSLV